MTTTSSDTTLAQLVINELTQAEYEALTPEANQLYLVPETTATVYPVIETYHDGADWYRIYSDGWCEQGGIVTRTATTPMSITLFKTYSDYNYNVNIQAQAADNYTTNSYTYSPYVISKTTTGFQAVQSSPAITAIGYFVWETKGYLAST